MSSTDMEGIRFVHAQESRFKNRKCSCMGSAVLHVGRFADVQDMGV